MKKNLQQKNKACPAKPWRNGGFTLIETLVAISIFSFSILALLSVLSTGVTNTTYAKKKIVAGYLAQEGIEYVRNMRDTAVLYDATSPQNGWNSFSSKISGCVSGNVCGFNSSTNPISIFNCTADSIGCKLYLNNGNYNDNGSSGVDSGFVRKIWITSISSDQVKIFSEVDWKQGSGNFSMTFSENLFNWVQ